MKSEAPPTNFVPVTDVGEADLLFHAGLLHCWQYGELKQCIQGYAIPSEYVKRSGYCNGSSWAVFGILTEI